MSLWLTACAAAGIALTASAHASAQETPPADPIPLWPGTPPHDHKDGFIPTLTPYLLDGDAPRGAVIVAPGGGYEGRAPHESRPIAERFNQAGFHAFVLDYRVSPNRHPAPLADAARSLRLVRSHAAEWRVRPDKIALLGFSAGGHLTASLGVLFDPGEPDADDPVARASSRPDAIVLCYPVISADEYGHGGSFANLLGPDASEEQRQALSLEKRVHADVPPAFLWSTADDQAVPVQNSLVFALALRQHGVPFEMHIYPHGPHGLGLSPDDPHIATWSQLCAEWLRGMGW